jgi:nitroimidazol reductase NimA-like FMN-containing flavoprotein (pyridoxamine 5'-phosphate oxidase superfamily)
MTGDPGPTGPSRPGTTAGPDAGDDTATGRGGGLPWTVYLSETECWDLLAGTTVGRVGVVVDTAPEIYPVSHVVDGRTIVFRTDPGNKLSGLERTPSVCYQIDSVNLGDSTGWSVLVKGRAVVVRETEELRRAALSSLRPWGLGEKAIWVRIAPTEVTGRRIERDPRAATVPGRSASGGAGSDR